MKKSIQFWEEVFKPLRWGSARVVFHYYRDIKAGMVQQYRVEWNMYEKKLLFSSFKFVSERGAVWRPTKMTKAEKEVLRDKFLRTIEREVKRMKEELNEKLK